MNYECHVHIDVQSTRIWHKPSRETLSIPLIFC